MIVRKLRKHADSDVNSKAGILFQYFRDQVKTEWDRTQAEQEQKKKRQKDKEAKK